MTDVFQLDDPGVYVEGSDWLPLEWQFTLGRTPYKWVTVGGAAAVCKIVNADTDAVVLDDAGTVTVFDDGRVSLDVDDTVLAPALVAGNYWRRYKVTLSGGEIYLSPRIYFTVQPDI